MSNKTNCIYRFLNKNNEILYIGKAKELNSRMNTHTHLPKECYNQVVKVEYCSFDSEYDMDFAERYYIPKLKPKYNTVYNNKEINFEIEIFDNITWNEFHKEKIKNKKVKEVKNVKKVEKIKKVEKNKNKNEFKVVDIHTLKILIFIY